MDTNGIKLFWLCAFTKFAYDPHVFYYALKIKLKLNKIR